MHSLEEESPNPICTLYFVNFKHTKRACDFFHVQGLKIYLSAHHDKRMLDEELLFSWFDYLWFLFDK